MKEKKGLLIVISGPSGVGKSTIRARIIKENPNFWYSVSMTTRLPRLIEKTNILEENGKDYYFVSIEEFKKNIKNNNFFEYAEVYNGLYYGTPKDKVLEMINKGYNVILEIDVQGAMIIKKEYPNALLIFIKPKTIKELKKRLRNRKTDTEKKIKERLSKAAYEISFSDKYDNVIISDTSNHDYEKVIDIINNKEKSIK